jgi:AcrR family transcriptional regulator
MSEQREKILEAAVRVFMRYGVGRTRMHDIAAEAGIVRQTLYLSYKNKNEILCAAIRHFAAVSLSEIQAGWGRSQSLEDKLDVFHCHAILSSFDLINASPEARDMIGGFNDQGRAAAEQAQRDKIAAWEACLADHHLVGGGASCPALLAEFIVLGSLGLRDHAQSKEQLTDLLAIQKQAVLAICS